MNNDHAPRRAAILVVDDSPEIAELAGEALEEAGYRVTIAHGAEEALEHFEAAGRAGDPFRLVFSDVMMAGGPDGLQLAKWVRERDPAVVVLMTTGYSDEMVKASTGRASMEVLGKPYRRDQLLDRVQANLRQGARPPPVG